MNSFDGQPEPLRKGSIVAGRYRIEGLLGRGGMGVVYEAEHEPLRKRVALKVLLPEHARNAEVIARFLREARAAASIGHPGIVDVIDLDVQGETAFLAMEKLEGEELFARIERERPLAGGFVARIGRDLADAVAAAHAHGIIHRDLKPQNVFLARRGRELDVVKVLDFGIAKLIDAERQDVSLTQTGQVFGTPLYMAPEQLTSSRRADPRSDVYGIGAILYQAVAGTPPFEAETFPALIVQIAASDPGPLGLRRPDVDPGLVRVIERAMTKDPEKRIQSARELCDALAPFADERAPSSRIPSPVSVTRDSLVSVPPPRMTGSGDVVGSIVVSRPEGASSRGRSRSVMALGAALLVLGGAAFVGWRVTHHDGHATPVAPVAMLAHESGPVTPVAATPVHPMETVAGDAAVETPPVSARVHFIIRPAGAEVRTDDRWCRSPCELELPHSHAVIEVSHAGYVTYRRTIEPPYPAEVDWALERHASVPSASHPTAEPVLLGR